jgi:uncharacterized protein (DUF1684 family)
VHKITGNIFKLTIVLQAQFFSCIFSICNLLSFAQMDTEKYLKEAQSYQDEINEAYADEASSPLNEEDLAQFTALPFFPISEDYIVVAHFEKFKKKQVEVFETSTSRMPSYVIYGKLYFEINGYAAELTLYQNPAFKKMKDLKNHLFLPFTDLTNGENTYGGGRYLDFYTPKKSESIILDFNQAYNPYCAYIDEYICPLPPTENILAIAIEAGERAYKIE